MYENEKHGDALPAKLSITNFDIVAPRTIRLLEGTKVKKQLVLELNESGSFKHERESVTGYQEHESTVTLLLTIPNDYREAVLPKLAEKLAKNEPEGGFMSVDELQSGIISSAREIFGPKVEIEVERMPANRFSGASWSLKG